MDNARMRDDLRRRFLRLSALNILANITVPLVGLVDTAMLGHLDDIRFLAGVALAAVLFDYVYWTFGFLRMGTTGSTAQAMGRGDRPEAYRVLYRSVVIAAGIAVGILVLQWPLRDLGFGLLSGEPGVEAAGRDYFDARIWGAPAALANFALVGWFLGREQSRHVLAMTVVANLVNVALNYVFIVRLDMAAAGAGFASMLSQYAMLAVGVGLFRAQGDRVRWVRAEVFDRTRIAALFRLNLDILVRTLCLISTFALFTNFSSMLGTATLAANALLLRLLTLASYLIDGAAFAAESLAGVSLGAGDRVALRRVYRLSMIGGEGFAALFLVALFAARDPVLRLLTSHDDLVRSATSYAPWLIPVVGIGAAAYMYDGIFLGLTEGRRLRNSMILSTVGVFIPIAIAAVALDSNHVLWAALAAFMAARVVTLAVGSRRIIAAVA